MCVLYMTIQYEFRDISAEKELHIMMNALCTNAPSCLILSHLSLTDELKSTHAEHVCVCMYGCIASIPHVHKLVLLFMLFVLFFTRLGRQAKEKKRNSLECR